MYRYALLLTAALTYASDAPLRLMLRAQTDFGAVEGAPFPRLEDTMRCVQSQAQVLPLLRPAEAPAAWFRKGYCQLLGAGITGNQADYRSAAVDFGKAVAAWPSRAPEPLPAALQAASAIARIQAGAGADEMPGIRAGLEEAENTSVCLANIMPAALCRDLVATGRMWQGWLAERERRLADAARHFAPFAGSGWNAWVAGRQAFEAGRYAAAGDLLRQAVDAWSDARRYRRPGVVNILGPRPDIGRGWFTMGEAQYLARQHTAAVASFDAALREDRNNAHAVFLRGRAREALGNQDAAQADYQLASRLAFANPDAPYAAGRAHYYRGVWLYGRKAFAQAEDEFASALNNNPGPDLRADVAAWRHLAAVAAGTCGTSVQSLASASRAASDLFLKQEAGALVDSCRMAAATLSPK